MFHLVDLICGALLALGALVALVHPVHAEPVFLTLGRRNRSGLRPPSSRFRRRFPSRVRNRATRRTCDHLRGSPSRKPVWASSPSGSIPTTRTATALATPPWTRARAGSTSMTSTAIARGAAPSRRPQ
jgi:hypothetical protein